MEFEVVDSWSQKAVIKLIGVGGRGGNAVNHMVSRHIEGIEFICADTDAQALKSTQAGSVMPLGNALAHGGGAGANPDSGRQAALDSRERIREVLEGVDLVFIAAGMGGCTGTGAAPVIAEIAKEVEVLTVAVVTMPFPFEGKNRRAVAEKGLDELSRFVDSLIAIPGEKLLPVLGKDTRRVQAFAAANDMMLGAVQGITDLITRPSLIGIDFADIRVVLSEMGMATIGIGVASGPKRARVAAEKSIASPMLDDSKLRGARGILINIAGGLDLGLSEFDEVGGVVYELVSEEAVVVNAISIDPDLQDELRVTVIATGIANRPNGQ
ncbi:MAG: cell division protein FtsZ [Methylococcaceae bacterium]|nr:cell division protein FtsZ [Methylococcaceae bacterium]